MIRWWLRWKRRRLERKLHELEFRRQSFQMQPFGKYPSATADKMAQSCNEIRYRLSVLAYKLNEIPEAKAKLRAVK